MSKKKKKSLHISRIAKTLNRRIKQLQKLYRIALIFGLIDEDTYKRLLMEDNNG